jgi:hypothetical protein
MNDPTTVIAGGSADRKGQSLRWAGFAVVLAVGFVGGLWASSLRTETAPVATSAFGHSPGDAIVVSSGGTGTDAWRQRAWANESEVCTEVETSVTTGGTCGVPDGMLPFWAVGIDARLVPASGASNPSWPPPTGSSVVFGVASPRVATLRVVGQGGYTWDAIVDLCPCSGLATGAVFFSTVVTTHRVSEDASGGKFVVLIALGENGEELGRIRAAVANL